MPKKQTMIEIQGGGATRKTGSCCGLLIRHSGSYPESINVDRNKLRLGGWTCVQMFETLFER